MTTQKAFASYEEIIDLHTESDSVSVIGIHTPTGQTPYRMMPGFFDQFRKYKYCGCSVALVPAATLPADPSQLSYEAGEPVIDARDMLNPILFHGCHGNDLGNILNRLYNVNSGNDDDLSRQFDSGSVALWMLANQEAGSPYEFDTDLLEALYYRALVDRTWQKANVQRGFKKAGLRPRVYSLATNMQLQNMMGLEAQGMPGVPAPFTYEPNDGDSALDDPYGTLSNPTAQTARFFTPRTVPLGWLDTRCIGPGSIGSQANVLASEIDDYLKEWSTQIIKAELPKIFMGVILLPPAYKTEMYFRMVITHYFAFAGFRGISMSGDVQMPETYHDWNDVLSTGDPQPEPEPGPEPGPEPEDRVTVAADSVITLSGRHTYYSWVDDSGEPIDGVSLKGVDVDIGYDGGIHYSLFYYDTLTIDGTPITLPTGWGVVPSWSNNKSKRLTVYDITNGVLYAFNSNNNNQFEGFELDTDNLTFTQVSSGGVPVGLSGMSPPLQGIVPDWTATYTDVTLSS